MSTAIILWVSAFMLAIASHPMWMVPLVGALVIVELKDRD